MQKLSDGVGRIVRVDDMDIHITIWSSHKRPVLAVSFKDGTKIHKIASFDSIEEADWFIECLSERIEKAWEYYSKLREFAKEKGYAET
jgi:hypothetical protein